MNNNLKTKLIILITILTTLSTGYGLWFLYKNGLIIKTLLVIFPILLGLFIIGLIGFYTFKFFYWLFIKRHERVSKIAMP